MAKTTSKKPASGIKLGSYVKDNITGFTGIAIEGFDFLPLSTPVMKEIERWFEFRPKIPGSFLFVNVNGFRSQGVPHFGKCAPKEIIARRVREANLKNICPADLRVAGIKSAAKVCANKDLSVMAAIAVTRCKNLQLFLDEAKQAPAKSKAAIARALSQVLR